jgi:hypothetical protein
MKPVLPLAGAMVEHHYRREPGTGKVIPEKPMIEAAKLMEEGRALWSQAQSAWDSIITDQSVAQGERVARGRKAVTNLATSIAKKLDAANAVLADEISAVRSRTSYPESGGEHAAEIRRALREMKADERAKAVEAALGSDDVDVLHAVLGPAPALLTGIDPARVEGFRQLWRLKHHPDALNYESRLTSALGAVKMAGTSLTAVIKELFEPHERMLAAAERAREAAVAAAKAVES